MLEYGRIDISEGIDVKESTFRIHFWYMSKDDAVNIMYGFNLVDKRGVL